MTYENYALLLTTRFGPIAVVMGTAEPVYGSFAQMMWIIRERHASVVADSEKRVVVVDEAGKSAHCNLPVDDSALD